MERAEQAAEKRAAKRRTELEAVAVQHDEAVSVLGALEAEKLHKEALRMAYQEKDAINKQREATQLRATTEMQTNKVSSSSSLPTALASVLLKTYTEQAYGKLPIAPTHAAPATSTLKLSSGPTVSVTSTLLDTSDVSVAMSAECVKSLAEMKSERLLQAHKLLEAWQTTARCKEALLFVVEELLDPGGEASAKDNNVNCTTTEDITIRSLEDALCCWEDLLRLQHKYPMLARERAVELLRFATTSNLIDTLPRSCTELAKRLSEHT
jgi:hypothetical protein